MKKLLPVLFLLALLLPAGARADLPFGGRLAKAAVELRKQFVVYNGSYYR